MIMGVRVKYRNVNKRPKNAYVSPVFFILLIIFSQPAARHQSLPSRPLRFMFSIASRYFIRIAGADAAARPAPPNHSLIAPISDSRGRTLRATGTVGMLTHSSNLDPLIVSAGPLRFHFVGKRIVFMIPVIGWIMYLWGHVPIDRRVYARPRRPLTIHS